MLNRILQHPQKLTRIAIVLGLVLLVVFWFSSGSSSSKQQRTHHPIEITTQPEQEDNQLEDDQPTKEEETTNKDGEIKTDETETDGDETEDDTNKDEDEDTIETDNNKETPNVPPNEEDDSDSPVAPNPVSTDNQGVDPDGDLDGDDDNTDDDNPDKEADADPQNKQTTNNEPSNDQTTTPSPTIETVDPDGDLDGDDNQGVDPDGDLDGNNPDKEADTDPQDKQTTNNEPSNDQTTTPSPTIETVDPDGNLDGDDDNTDENDKPDTVNKEPDVDETNPATDTNATNQVDGDVDPDGDTDDEDYTFDKQKDGKTGEGKDTTTSAPVQTQPADAEPSKKTRNVFFDFGASNGVATEAFLAKSAGEGEEGKNTLAGRGAEGEWDIYLVEANPRFEETLKKLQEKLQGEKRLKVTLLTNKAVCPTAGNVTLLYDPECENCSGSADPTHKDYVNRLHEVKKMQVPCLPINELLTRYAVEDTVVMKVDVECMEMSLLKAILTAGTLPLIDEYAITWHEYCIDSLQVRTLQWILADSPSKLLKWR